MSDAKTHPWKMFLPLGIVLVLAAAWTIYWFIASEVAKSRFQETRERLAAEGLTFSCATESWAGFPFHFEYSCSAPAAALSGKGEARAKQLLLVALAYAPQQIVALLDGPTTISTGTLKPVTVKHERAIAAITFDDRGEPKLSSEFPALVIDGIGSVKMLMAHSRPSPGGGTDIAVSATEVNYQPPGKPALTIDKVNMLATLHEDNKLKVSNISAQKGEIQFSGSGTAGLDGQRRIAGQIGIETNDMAGLIALLSPVLDLTDAQASGLGTMLALLGDNAKASVIAKDGTLYLGPVRIADLLPVY